MHKPLGKNLQKIGQSNRWYHVKGRFKITDRTSDEVALPSRIYQKKTNVEPADHDKITPLDGSMFTKPSPNCRQKTSIFLEKKTSKNVYAILLHGTGAYRVEHF